MFHVDFLCAASTETCLLTRGKHVSTVQALTTCQAFSLDVDSFHSTLDGFPDVKTELNKIALQQQESV